MTNIIYSTENCPRCQALKAAYRAANIAYEEQPLEPAIISECLTETGIWNMEAPLVKDGHVWHFASDLFDTSGNLKANWLVELMGVRPHKEFSGTGGQPDQIARSSSKIWGDL
ncbi:MAG: hypothetical protein WC124_02105 [Desulfoplanes sp.]